ncbi:MAG: hypothetical protein LAT82_00930 [Nanoarchaeota archaeon]|nr:hypothetical protein [Nanoarchaeota archaeon]
MVRNNTDKQYISFDIEASGPIPAKYSMLSLGACVVGDISEQFYREIKPLNINFQDNALRIGCLELDLLKERGDEFNSRSPLFNPKRTLELLMDEAQDPKLAMQEYRDWLSEVKSSKNAQVEAAAPIGFDRQFSNWYFHNFLDESPFGNRSEDMNSMYRGVIKDTSGTLKDITIDFKNQREHHALYDAICQAQLFEKVLEMIKKKRVNL